MRVYTSQGTRVQGYTQEDMEQWLRWARMVTMLQTDAEMRADAQARVDRLQADIVVDVDICGLQDWADAMGWV